MEVTILTWGVAVAGLLLIGLLSALQLVAVIHPRERWTINNVYGGAPEATDPNAYFAFNQGQAWADPFFWAPLQIAGSVGMLLGQQWGFLARPRRDPCRFATAQILIFIWDRDMGFRQNTFSYWVVVWGMWPAFGVLEGAYCFVRLLE